LVHAFALVQRSVDRSIALRHVTTGMLVCRRKIVLPYYSSRVDFTVGTCILLGLGLLSLGGVALLMPSVGSCDALLLVCHIAPSVRYTGPCSEFDVDIATLARSCRVDLRWGSGSRLVQLRLPSFPYITLQHA
jgi:hypothetical protein